MSIVTPIPQNTTIKAYKGIPWDNTLSDIRWFASESERSSYLNSKIIGQWNNCSVQSPGKSIRVQGYYNNFLECNYISWVNNQSGTPARTIYAYVTSVSYLNVNTVEISYEVDWIQTYLFDFVFEATFVEREHVNSDGLGENILDEGLDFGEYQIDQQKKSDFQPAVILTYYSGDGMEVKAVDNIAVCGAYRFATLSQLSVINDILEANADTPERISSIFMCVADMIVINNSGFFNKDFNLTEYQTFLPIAGTGGAGAYTPQNKKLLCYPYKFLTADNFGGSVQQYRWELCNTKGSFEGIINGNCIPKPSMHFFPINYRKATATSQMTNDYKQEGLWYDNFPMCNYASDTYKAWVSQFGVSYAVEKAASVAVPTVMTLAGVATGNVPMGVAGAASLAGSLVGQGASTYNELKEKQIHSLQSHGSVGQSGLNFADWDIGFRLTAYSISQEDAKRIDKYFTRFGYRVDTVKIPNVTGRQNVNYVKCRVGRVEGNIAVDAKVQMERALQQGVTFWHINDVGSDIISNPIV